VLAAQAQRQREYRAKPGVRDAESRRAKERYITLEGWRKAIIARLKFRAKKSGLEFDLKPDDLDIPSHCPVLGLVLVAGRGVSFRTSANSPSVDRFDNSKGYVRGNVRVISNRANILKRDATVEEMAAILAYMRGEVS
jgi:hypothetical protein